MLQKIVLEGGSRHFREVGNCSSVKSGESVSLFLNRIPSIVLEGSSATCSRAALICCLRAMIDSSCRAGMDTGRKNEKCAATSLTEFGGGAKKVKFFGIYEKLVICDTSLFYDTISVFAVHEIFSQFLKFWRWHTYIEGEGNKSHMLEIMLVTVSRSVKARRRSAR